MTTAVSEHIRRLENGETSEHITSRKLPNLFRGESRQARETRAAFMFLSPYLITTIIFTVSVFIFAFVISFTKYNLFQPPQWVGLEHYKSFFSDVNYIHSLVNVFYYVMIVVPIQTALALVLAAALNAPMRAKRFFRTVFYTPSVTSSVVISFIFMWLYMPTGYINYGFFKLWAFFGAEWELINFLNEPTGLFMLLLAPLGIAIPLDKWWFQGPSVTWMAIMFQNIYTTIPTYMIMFLAALQDIPPSLYEAASIDGANTRDKFFKITIPMLRPIILLVAIMGAIGAWQIFDQVKLLTAGGPLNTTLVPVYIIYTEGLGFTGPPQMGYASSRAIILGAIVIAFTLIQRRFIQSGTEQY